MKTRVCLVNPKLEGPYPPLGLAYIASYLREYGAHSYDIRIVDGNCENIYRGIEIFKPQIVGVRALSYQIKEAVSVSRWLREKDPEVLQIIGGIHVSAEPRVTLSRGMFDYAVLGEGEQTFCEIVDSYLKDGPSFEKHKIKGIAFFNEGQFTCTEPRPEIRELRSIPYPARDLLNMRYYLSHYLLIRGLVGNRIATIHTSRGCPFRCTFCSCNIIFKTVRYAPTDYVITEIEELVEKYKAKSLFFTDDTFILNKKRVRDICNALIQTKLADKISWEVQGRAELVDWSDIELFQLMKKAGCVQIDYGFESGSDRVLSMLKKANANVIQNKKAMDITKKSGLHVVGTFMLGTPGETDEEIEETKQFILRNIANIDFFQVFVTTPFPGTELYDICQKRGIVKKDYFDQMEQESSEDGLKIYSDTVSPRKVAETFAFLNQLGLSKVKNRYKLSWAIHNFARKPTATIAIITNYIGKRIKNKKLYRN